MTKTTELSVFLHPKQAKRRKKEGPTAPRGARHILIIWANTRAGKVPADGTNVPTHGKELPNYGTNDNNIGNKRKIQTQNGEKQVSKQKATSHKKERKQA